MTDLKEAITVLRGFYDSECARCSIADNCEVVGKRCKLLESISLAMTCMTIKLKEPNEITLEKAIDYLTEIGWLPNHDRELTEHKQGKWIEDISVCYPNYPSGFRCSICSHWYTSKTPCCPNCGARMTH